MGNNPIYDFFISYNRKDKGTVGKIAALIKKYGYKVWVDSDDIKPGDDWFQKIEDGITNCRIIIVCFGPKGLGQWQKKESGVAQKLVGDRPEHVKLIPFLLPGANEENLPPFLSRFQYIDFRNESEWDNKVRELIDLEECTPPQENIEDLTIDFFNRESELKTIDLENLEKSLHHFILIDAPSGYGKSRLLKHVYQKTKTNSEKWSSCYIDFSYCRGDQIAYIVKSISGRVDRRFSNEEAEEFLCEYIKNTLISPSKSNGRDRCVIFIIDSIEQLTSFSQKWFVSFLHEAINQSYSANGIVQFVIRIIVGGRNTDHFWIEYINKDPNALAPLRVPLSAFDVHAIQELIWTKANELPTRTSNVTIHEISNELIYLGGGHPGVICQIVDEFKDQDFIIPNVKEHFAKECHRYTQRYISPVAQEIYASQEEKARKVLQVISCFRLCNIPILRNLMQECLLESDIEPVDQLGRLSEAKILYPPTLTFPFYSNSVIRRILSLDLAYGNGKDEELLRKIHNSAKNLFESWIINHNEQRFAIIEWLFHSLQIQSLVGDQIREQFQDLLTKLPDIEGPHSLVDMIQEEVNKDQEIQYLLKRKFGSFQISDWFVS